MDSARSHSPGLRRRNRSWATDSSAIRPCYRPRRQELTVRVLPVREFTVEGGHDLFCVPGHDASSYFLSASGTSHSLRPCAQTSTTRLPSFSAYSISQSTHSLSLVFGEI